MNRTWHFYDAVTGVLNGRSFNTSIVDQAAALRSLEANTPHGCAAIVGDFDHLSQRVDVTTGAVMDYQPPAPSADHEWDEVSKRWKLNAAVAAREVARTSAAAQIRDLESKAIRALIEQALGQEGAKERLEALHKQITDLRPALSTPET